MGGIYHKGEPYSGQMVCDSVPSLNSNNPMKNKALTAITGFLADLDTTDKSSLVDAINELVGNEYLLKASLPVKTDCNIDWISSGIRMYFVASNSSNSPHTEEGLIIDIDQGSSNWKTQFWIDTNSNKYGLYFRRKQNGTWDSSWKQIYDSTIGTIYTYSVGSSAESFTAGTAKTYTLNTTIPAGTYMISFETVCESTSNGAYDNLEITVNGSKHRYYKGSCLGGAFPNVCVDQQSISVYVMPVSTSASRYFYINFKLLRIA